MSLRSLQPNGGYVNARTIFFLLSFLMFGCEKISPFVSDALWNSRHDVDHDGIPWPGDCDDHDPNVGILIFYGDVDKDGFGAGAKIISCIMPTGATITNNDCDDARANNHPNASEMCDGLDNDCNGKTDETFPNLGASCGTGVCFGGTILCTNDHLNTACSGDQNKSTEICDGLDNDCNGTTDEPSATDAKTFFADVDQDGYGNPLVIEKACTASSGHVSNDLDCNDLDKQVHPNVIETCNAVDDNCNGKTDEGVLLTFFKDTDEDGYGNLSQEVTGCTISNGYVVNGTDCNDGNKNIHPNAIEICDNQIDENCDGITDNALEAKLLYLDSDKDGYGNAAIFIYACATPTGYVSDKTDCNDVNQLVHPNATELCGDGIDNNCNGITDTDAKVVTWYLDLDKDGFGDATQSKQDCAQPIGYVENATDCSDTNASIYPSANEVCNNEVDDNCDGSLNQCVMDANVDVQKTDVLFTGDKPANLAGWSVASGDVNNDGKDDVIIGAPQNAEGGSNAGAVYIFFGPITPGSFNLTKANIKLIGEAVNDNAGWSVASGDLNNDGKDDVMIGAPQNSEGGLNAGAAYIFFGPLAPGKFNLNKTDVKLIGETVSDNAGWCVTSSDLDDDQINDTIISAYRNDAGGVDSGAVYILTGPLAPGKFNLSKAKTKLVGEAVGDNSGWSMAAVQDVNNDQMNDIMIGAYRNDAGGADAGAAYIVFGPFMPGVFSLKTANVKLIGEASNDFAGFRVGSAGDINHDSHADVITSAIFQNAGGAYAGAAYIFTSPLTPGKFNLNKANIKLVGEASGDYAGWNFTGNGDLNHDGNDDLAIGLRQSASGLFTVGYVFLGPIKNGSISLSNANAKLTATIQGLNENMGTAFVFGSFNEDNTSDLVIGMCSQKSDSKDPGKISILFGKGL